MGNIHFSPLFLCVLLYFIWYPESCENARQPERLSKEVTALAVPIPKRSLIKEE